MTEILNLSEVCRCCHSSGVFKSLVDPFTYEGNVEVYSDLIRDVLGIYIRKPLSAGSHTICEQCIMQLRFCRSFKQQVLECERKFQAYCKDELFQSGALKTEKDAEDKRTKQTSVAKANSIDTDKGPKQTSAAKTNSIDNKETVPTPYSCEFCNQRFSKKQTLREHEIKKHHNKALSCNICELTFKTHLIRAMHMKKHNSTGNGLRCQHCDKYYGSEEVLIEHINSHLRGDVYQCMICPKKFPYKHSLHRHKEWHKQKFTESHISLNECSICSMVFKKPAELRTHMVCSHKSEFNKQRYVSKSRRKRGNGPFKCDVCNKLFSCRFTLNRHILVVHKGVKQQKCKLCPMVFSTVGILNRHIRNVHEAKRKEKCDICNKLCNNLKEHKNVHLRPVKCEVCFKGFPAQNTLNRHIKFVHMQQKPFTCEHCDQIFDRIRTYRKHLLQKHDLSEVKTEISKDNMD